MDSSKLYRWRKAHKLTQAALSKLLGVSTRTLIRWEKGDSKLPKVVFLALRSLTKQEIEKGEINENKN